MITMNFDWREVLWWLKGGMSGSHLRWGVYEDMVNKVWPQCDEQERRNMWLIMRRDLGDYWRPEGWSGNDLANAHGEGEWKKPLDYGAPEWNNKEHIGDVTPWMYFRQVLARFDPENQYAVTMNVHNQDELDEILRFLPAASIISRPKIPRTKKAMDWHSDTATVTVRAYHWDDEYRINWTRRCAQDHIAAVERLDIPDNGEL